MAAKIVVVGSFNADLTSYMARMPRPGETVAGQRFVTGPGGKGSNQAVAAARLGAAVTFIGRIGQDVFASIALDCWKEAGINTDYVVQDPEHSTGVAPIFVDESGENSIVVVLGANLAVSREDVDAAAEIIVGADILLTQLEINYDTTSYALKVAKEQGVMSILNPAPAGQVPDDLVALADIITPNETELEVLSGLAGVTTEEAAGSLLKHDRQMIIVTLGAQGARLVDGSGSALIPAYQIDVVDTTGAGDAFNGGLAVGLAEGMGQREAIAFANATAALCVTRPGTAPSMPKRSEVEALLSGRWMLD